MNCRRCSLAGGRYRVVLFRGEVPCDLLFVGEAPGESEDILGEPFVGDAGSILDVLIEEIKKDSPDLTIGITNLVCCRPPKNRTPLPDEIDACWKRLEEQIDRCHPEIIVTLGESATKFLVPKLQTSFHIDLVSVVHPAFIVRVESHDRVYWFKKALVPILDALERFKYLDGAPF